MEGHKRHPAQEVGRFFLLILDKTNFIHLIGGALFTLSGGYSG